MEGERVLKCHLVDLGGDKVDPHLEVGIVTEIGTPPKEGAEVDIGLAPTLRADHTVVHLAGGGAEAGAELLIF